MKEISRDPLDLVAQTIGAHHQYPDGLVLFMGTLLLPRRIGDSSDRASPIMLVMLYRYPTVNWERCATR